MQPSGTILQPRSVCPECGKPVLVRYDLEAIAREVRRLVEPVLTKPIDQVNLAPILAGLLEGLGAGRRLLRNTRAVIEGLPEREVLTHKLSLPAEATPALLASLTGEFDEHAAPLPAPVLSDDPRLAWLLDYLEKNERDKLVLICSTIARAEAVASSTIGPSSPLRCISRMMSLPPTSSPSTYSCGMVGQSP